MQVLHRYTMAEDPALAVAFANSLRSAAVATLKARACERGRAERSEQMDFLIRNVMMPSISGGPGRELGP